MVTHIAQNDVILVLVPKATFLSAENILESIFLKYELKPSDAAQMEEPNETRSESLHAWRQMKQDPEQGLDSCPRGCPFIPAGDQYDPTRCGSGWASLGANQPWSCVEKSWSLTPWGGWGTRRTHFCGTAGRAGSGTRRLHDSEVEMKQKIIFPLGRNQFGWMKKMKMRKWLTRETTVLGKLW